MLLKDRTAIVHGGSGDIGSAVAHAYAREGAEVHLTGRSETPSRRSPSALGTGAGSRTSTSLTRWTVTRLSNMPRRWPSVAAASTRASTPPTTTTSKARRWSTCPSATSCSRSPRRSPRPSPWPRPPHGTWSSVAPASSSPWAADGRRSPTSVAPTSRGPHSPVCAGSWPPSSAAGCPRRLAALTGLPKTGRARPGRRQPAAATTPQPRRRRQRRSVRRVRLGRDHDCDRDQPHRRRRRRLTPGFHRYRDLRGPVEGTCR